MRQRHAQSVYFNKKEEIPERSHAPEGGWDLLSMRGVDDNQVDV